jgi:SAM-dependent methyltransferase
MEQTIESRPEVDFVDVTEMPDEPISDEQLVRLIGRYKWATEYCAGSDVVEVGCGAGPGLGMLAAASRSLVAGDVSPAILNQARAHYGDRVPLGLFSGESLPYPDLSKDVIILFEAIYYLKDAQRFVTECRRVLRPGGYILLSTANKDLWDFHPSPHTYTYYGVTELGALLGSNKFDSEFFGFQSTAGSPLRQRILRPVKRLAVATGLMPSTMRGKRLLRRLVFGPSVPMPRELSENDAPYLSPESISAESPDVSHKIIYCAARKRN